MPETTSQGVQRNQAAFSKPLPNRLSLDELRDRLAAADGLPNAQAAIRKEIARLTRD